MAAAVVQVVGLSRWFLIVPGISADATDPTRAAAAFDRFETVHFWLGRMLGETVGDALTATFTLLVVRHVTRALAPRSMTVLGLVSAALIATGVLIPLGVAAASMTNFAGYVAWCLWLIAMAVVLWRSSSRVDVRSRPAAVTTDSSVHA